MQNLIKRHFWVVGAVTVMACAIFAAKAFGHVIEAALLGDPAHAPKVAPAPQRPDVAPKPPRTKEGGQLALRNVFCSECTPPVVAATDPSQIAITLLPLQLLVTNIGATDKQSSAIVMNSESAKQGTFFLGDVMPGASGPIKGIHYKYVDFENAGRIERVMLGGTAPIVAVAPPVEVDKPVSDDDKLLAAIDNGIKKIDDTTFEIDKSLIETVKANPMAFMKGARVVPAMKNGKPEGIKLYAIRPNSPYAKLGLTNGDTLQSINSFELTSIDKGLEIYQKLSEATSLQIEVIRRGKPMTLKYTIR